MPKCTREVACGHRQVSKAPVSDLPVIFASWLNLPLVSNEEVFSAVRTFWLFIWQVLSADRSCQCAVAKAAAWVASENGAPISPCTSAYCQARRRLSLAWLGQIVEQLVQRLNERSSHMLWCGREVVVVDGSSMSMPDTKENQEQWPQPSGQKTGCGFPVMRIVALFSLASGALIETATGSLKISERALWRSMWRKLKRGTIALFDRGFESFGEFYFLGFRGVDCVARHNCGRVHVRTVKRLGPGDCLVQWLRPRKCPDWIEPGVWSQMPETMLLRQITCTVSRPGWRTKHIRLITTLLDPEAFPAEAFGELYLRRWHAELWLRDLKTTMGMEQLRCKTPQMIQRELLVSWIGYNLVRALMLDAALHCSADPTRISFKFTTQLLHEWTILAARARTTLEQTQMLNLLLDYLGHQMLPKRSRASQPRAVKRRPKNYQRMTSPRHEFTEIKHRNSYYKKRA